MKNQLFAVALASGFAVSLLAQTQPAQPAPKPFFPPLAGEYTPTSPPEIANLPTPGLPNGQPDLSGPSGGGGSNPDIERDGAVKPGDRPLLPVATALRAPATEG